MALANFLPLSLKALITHSFMLWLGGDMSFSTSEDSTTMNYYDSILDFSDQNTLWSLGNHDYANLNLIETYTNRPSFYSYYRNGLSFIVLDTQDDFSNISGDQLDLITSVTDTIEESSHLVILHHKLIWMYGNTDLEPIINDVSNGQFGDCFYCLNPNNWYEDIHPMLQVVQQSGIQVICVGGDIGFETSQFEYTTSEGIKYLASGISDDLISSKALIFDHNTYTKELCWHFELLSEI